MSIKSNETDEEKERAREKWIFEIFIAVVVVSVDDDNDDKQKNIYKKRTSKLVEPNKQAGLFFSFASL